MKKAIRRHQQQVAKRRKLVILYREAHGHSWKAFDRYWMTVAPRYVAWLERPWMGYHRLQLNEPGRWEHEMMIQPSRIRQNQRLRLVENGIDPDELEWPDYKKPVIYYW
jgi:hypothetical protein